MGYFQKETECMPREEIKRIQSERLVWQVARMYDRVELFRKRMDEKKLKPEDIKSIDDLSKLPFSYKQDLRDYYPYGLFAEPLKNIVRTHASSGTTGKQIVVGYTRHDLEMWADCMARQLAAAGTTDEDVVQVSYGYGLFTGGLGAHAGAERIGATVVPTSSGNTARQIQTMVDFGTTVLCCTPSYAMYLAEAIEEAGLRDKIRLKSGVFGAEPWTENMRHAIEDSLGIKAFDVYGLSEIMGPGVSYECECQKGMHVNEDMFVPEIIDPDTGEVLPEGAQGELVFTTLTKEGFPVIRYRTRDICSLNYEQCECGRTFVRMNKPTGRSDDMMIIRGVNVFPSQIEEVLLRISEGVTPNYQIIVGRENNTDTLDINVEMTEKLFADDVKSIEKIEKKIVSDLRSVLGIGAKVHLVNPKTIARSEGKAKRVIDNRNLHE
ncbi:MAG: phenylacetate--CoA ligase [Eubacteriales bacterium]|nr:phenylacetate--CoA ligase [Eubacteriales bacterium]MDO5585799.1 phenylacetate--CoA ligase [Clostridia bacterium]MDY4212131.1 phenylacetate--CoA ligase [Eubacteriales bacterium]MDY5231064.1 phenylacetate--CoA ligase [Eubacteriales bacterium]